MGKTVLQNKNFLYITKIYSTIDSGSLYYKQIDKISDIVDTSKYKLINMILMGWESNLPYQFAISSTNNDNILAIFLKTGDKAYNIKLQYVFAPI